MAERSLAQLAEKMEGIATPGLTLIRVGAERLHYWHGCDEGELGLAERAEA